jgi:protein TonB
MNDPVSQELERRAHLELPWRRAILGAFAIHLAVIAALLLTPAHRQRALRLPAVLVRLTAAPLPAGAAHPATAAAAPPAQRHVPVPSPKAAVKKQAEPPPRHPLPAKKPARELPPAQAEPGAAGVGKPAGPGVPGQQRAASSGIALGLGGGGEDQGFPFTYYLNRVLALIESNWFRPPVPADTRCQVRCVIDRSGRLVEAGLEQESLSPAFDRAALRAVYASAPFPPLPQGFGGTTLTLHLEFGQ